MQIRRLDHLRYTSFCFRQNRFGASWRWVKEKQWVSHAFKVLCKWLHISFKLCIALQCVWPNDSICRKKQRKWENEAKIKGPRKPCEITVISWRKFRLILRNQAVFNSISLLLCLHLFPFVSIHSLFNFNPFIFSWYFSQTNAKPCLRRETRVKMESLCSNYLPCYVYADVYHPAVLF